MLKLEKELGKIKQNILGLAEVKRKEEKLIISNNWNLFYYYGETKGFPGIGFSVTRHLKNRVLECKGIMDRIGYFKIRFGKGGLCTNSWDRRKRIKPISSEPKQSDTDRRRILYSSNGDFNPQIGKVQ